MTSGVRQELKMMIGDDHRVGKRILTNGIASLSPSLCHWPNNIVIVVLDGNTME